MEIEKLLQEIKKEGEKEKESARKEYELMFDKIDKEKEAEIEALVEREENLLEKEKERLLAEYKEKEKFNARMRLLGIKKNLLYLATERAKNAAFALSDKEKKKIYSKEIESVDIGKEEKLVIKIPLGKRDFFAEVFGKIEGEIREEGDLVFEDGFVIEGSRFIFEVTLGGIIEQQIEDEKDYFANILFNS